MKEFAHSKKTVRIVSILVILLCIGVILNFIFSSHILHRKAKSISPDGAIKYEVYNISLEEKTKESENEVLTIQEYQLTEGGTEWKLLSSSEIPGYYIVSSWSGDGRYFVVCVESEEGRLYLFDNEEKYMRKLDEFLDMQLINKVAFDSELYRHMLSANRSVQYEFVQWAKNGHKMLIRYVDTETGDTKEEDTHFEGYFWYHCPENSIEGYMDAVN